MMVMNPFQVEKFKNKELFSDSSDVVVVPPYHLVHSRKERVAIDDKTHTPVSITIHTHVSHYCTSCTPRTSSNIIIIICRDEEEMIASSY
jgi:hypothetical protein